MFIAAILTPNILSLFNLQVFRYFFYITHSLQKYRTLFLDHNMISQQGAWLHRLLLIKKKITL